MVESCLLMCLGITKKASQIRFWDFKYVCSQCKAFVSRAPLCSEAELKGCRLAVLLSSQKGVKQTSSVLSPSPIAMLLNSHPECYAVGWELKPCPPFYWNSVFLHLFFLSCDRGKQIPRSVVPVAY